MRFVIHVVLLSYICRFASSISFQAFMSRSAQPSNPKESAYQTYIDQLRSKVEATAHENLSTCVITEGRGCHEITEEFECLSSRDGRSGLPTYENFPIYKQECVWCSPFCGNGNKCEPFGWLHGKGMFKSEFKVANCEEDLVSLANEHSDFKEIIEFENDDDETNRTMSTLTSGLIHQDTTSFELSNFPENLYCNSFSQENLCPSGCWWWNFKCHGCAAFHGPWSEEYLLPKQIGYGGERWKMLTQYGCEGKLWGNHVYFRGTKAIVVWPNNHWTMGKKGKNLISWGTSIDQEWKICHPWCLGEESAELAWEDKCERNNCTGCYDCLP